MNNDLLNSQRFTDFIFENRGQSIVLNLELSYWIRFNINDRNCFSIQHGNDLIDIKTSETDLASSKDASSYMKYDLREILNRRIDRVYILNKSS